MRENKIYGLIGKNIDYSFSKNFFSKKFKNENINCKYLNFDIQNISDFKSVISDKNISGLNVTIPYKEDVIKYIDEISNDAKSIGAVNTIKISNKKLTGHNTDHIGFTKSIEKIDEFKNIESALILGSGGASKAIQFALDNMKIKYTIVSRSNSIKCINYNQVSEKIIKNHKLIINCTPLGTFPEVEKCPEIDYRFLSPFNILYDLVYNPKQSSFLRKGVKAGCKIKNGLEMLEIQAIESWKIWNS